MTIIVSHSVANRYRSIARLALLLGLLLYSHLAVPAQSFNVTAFSLDNYFIDGQNDPTLTLQRGVTYVFNLSGLDIHPFWIKTSLGFGSTGRYDSGVANNGGTSGTLTFTVPANAPNQLLYQCGNHFDMTGTLNIVTPATPPTVRIVYINVSDFITVKSTGTNGWTASPEFKCDLSTPAWSPIANFTNTFNTGTNTTTFPRLDPICGSTNVLIRIRNQSN